MIIALYHDARYQLILEYIKGRSRGVSSIQDRSCCLHVEAAIRLAVLYSSCKATSSFA